MRLTRRSFLKAATILGGASRMLSYQALAATTRGKVKITGIKTMMLQGPRTYTLVKILTDSGLYGLGEAYGSPGVGVREGIVALTPNFIGKDPLDIEALYEGLGQRVDGSAHMLLRAVTGIDVALFDLAGKILNVPAATLLGGPLRKRMRMYTDQGPRNLLDKAACRDWAAKMKESPAGWTGFKFAFAGGAAGETAGAAPAGGRGSAAPAASQPAGGGRESSDDSAQRISNKEIIAIGTGFENCREALGWDYDIMYHVHWQFDLDSAIRLSEALAPSKPAWLEDPMPPNFSDAWVRLTELSKVPILTGENLGRHHEWTDFFFKHGINIGQLDMRNVGGLAEAKRISDLADVAYIPMCAHNTGCIVNNYATLQWACTVRDFIASETVIGNGDWMDDVILHDGPIVKDSHIELPDKPGLGIELNPDVVKAHLAKDEQWWG